MKKPKNATRDKLVFFRSVPTINPLHDKNIVTPEEVFDFQKKQFADSVDKIPVP